MTRGWTVTSLVLVFMLLGTCSGPQPGSDVAADSPAGGRPTGWWDQLRGLVDAEPAPPPEPKVTRLLRRLRHDAAEGGAGQRERNTNAGADRQRAKGNDTDNPNVAVPPAIVSAALARPPSRRGRLGRLRIPAIGLDVAYRSGVHEGAVNRGPGHWPGTPLPGSAGNSVLSGHRTTFTHPFLHLDRLRKGDKIRTSVGKSDPVVYRVVDTTIVPESRYVKFVLRKPKRDTARRLTLFACHPKGSRRERIVVEAVADPVEPRKKPARKRARERGGEPPPIYVADNSDVWND